MSLVHEPSKGVFQESESARHLLSLLTLLKAVLEALLLWGKVLLCVTVISGYILPPPAHGNVQVKMNADFTKRICIHSPWWLWVSEPITLSWLEIGLLCILTVWGGEEVFDTLVNMHAGLSPQFWACSQVERCVDQVLTLCLEPSTGPFWEVGRLSSL